MIEIYELIPAEEKHLDQIVPLLASTGYWDSGLKYNSMGLDSRKFMREFIAKPHLPFTTIAVKKEASDTVLGVIVCASKAEILAMPDYGPPLDPKVIELFKNLFEFELTESFHISFIAISKSARNQGIGKKLLQFAEDTATKRNFETLSLYTISCQTSSIRLYLKFGMMITKIISLSEKLPFPYALYFEKNKQLTSMLNYFETEEFQNLNFPE